MVSTPHGPADDLSTLSWVQEELRRSLEGVNKALKRHLRELDAGGDLDAADPAVLRQARQQLHQSVGALELVGLPQVARVLRAGEQALQRLAPRPQQITPAVVQQFEQACFGVVDLVARRLAGRPVSALALFPQYRVLQELAGQPRVHPVDLWELPWSWRLVQPPVQVAVLSPDEGVVARFESDLLQLMRSGAPEVAERLCALCAGLAGTPAVRLSALWSLAAAFHESIGRGLLRLDMHSKRIGSRLLSVLRGGTAAEPPERLAHELLLQCSRADLRDRQGPGPWLQAVRQIWSLPETAGVDLEQARLGRVDPAVVQQARKRIGAAKDVWQAVAGGHTEQLAVLNEQFALIGESIQRLFPDSAVLTRALQATAQQVVASGTAPASALAMELATALLYVEAAVDDGDYGDAETATRVQRLADRLEQVRAGRDPGVLELWMEELYRRVSDRQTMGSVVHELRETLSEIEQLIDQYFRDPARRDLLIPVPAKLQAMRGVLSVLALDQASHAVLRMAEDVDGLASTEVDPQLAIRAGTFDRLADNLGALSFMIDMVGFQPQMAKALFRFDHDDGVLRGTMARADRPTGFDDLLDSVIVPAEVTLQPLAMVPAAPPVLTAALAERDFDAPGAGDVTQMLGLHPLDGFAPPLASPSGSAPFDGLEPLETAPLPAAADQPTAWSDAADTDVVSISDPTPTLTLPGLASALQGAPTGVDGWPTLPAGGLLRLDDVPPLPVAPAPAPAAAPELDEDAEMREIFLEEARDVIRQARESCERLAEDGGDHAALTAVRRAFHTLKGSARMVGLERFGAAAWSCEQLFNVRLADHGPADADLLGFTGEALDHLADWIEDVARQDDAGRTADRLSAAADALRLEGRRVPLAETAPAPSDSPLVALDTRAAAAAGEAAGFTAAWPGAAGDAPTDAFTGGDAIEDPAVEVDTRLATGFATELQTELQTELATARLDGTAVPAAADAALPSSPMAGETADVADAADLTLAFPEPATAGWPLGDTVTVLAGDGRIQTGDDAALAVDVVQAEDHFVADVTGGEAAAAPADGGTVAWAPSSPDGSPVSLSGLDVDGLPAMTPPSLAGALAPTLAPAVAPALDASQPLPEPLPLPAAELARALDTEAVPAPGLDALVGSLTSADLPLPTPDVAELPSGTLAEAVVAGEALPPAPAPAAEEVRQIGPLRLSQTLFNIFLQEADDWSRRLSQELADWALQLHLPLGGTAPALAHSLAGGSATVGHAGLSRLARALEHALDRTQARESSDEAEATLYLRSADEIRSVLHQFAAGFLQDPDEDLVQALDAVVHAVQDGLSVPLAPAFEAAEPTASGEFDPPTQALEVPELADGRLSTHAGSDIAIDLEADGEALAGLTVTGEPSPAAMADDEVTGHWPGGDGPAPDIAEASHFVAPGDSVPDFDDDAGAGVSVLGDLDDGLTERDQVDAELFPFFVEEGADQLSQLYSAVRGWALKPGDPAAASPCMRVLHTFKGGARLAGAMRLGEMAHRLESAVTHLATKPHLQTWRIEQLQGQIDALQTHFDLLRQQVEDQGPGGMAVSALAPMVLPAWPAADELDFRASPAVADPAAQAPAPDPDGAGTPPEAAGWPAVSFVDAAGQDAADGEAEGQASAGDAAAPLPPMVEPHDVTAMGEVHAFVPSFDHATAGALSPLAAAAGFVLPAAAELDLRPAAQPLDIELPTVVPDAALVAQVLDDDGATGGSDATAARPLPVDDRAIGADDAAYLSPPEPLAVDLPAPVVPLVAAPVDPPAEPPAIDWQRFAGQQPAPDLEPEMVPPAAQQRQSAVATVRVRAQLLDRLVNQAGEVSIARARIEANVLALKSAFGDLSDNLERLRSQLRDIELQAELQINTRMEAARSAQEQFDPLEMDRFTRFQELTRMMAESVSDVATVQRGLTRAVQSAEDALAHQSRMTHDMQDELLRTRMVEFEALSERLSRVVRQAARESGRQVRLDIVGGAIEIDRGVLDRMTPAFEHLLRNAVVHGIESPEQRQAGGKDATGLITLGVSQQGNEVVVEVADDGAGLNLARIHERALAQGLVKPGEHPAESELAQMVFMPGFTTANEVTDLAGRGVGMDVVRTEVSAMGGRIETRTQAGQGTAFRLVLPLTTAVTQVVMMRCGERAVAVPSTLIETLRRVSADELAQAYAQGSFVHNGETLPFHWLDALLEGAPCGHAAQGHAMLAVIRSAAQRVVLHVDEVTGNQEVVVKNLGPQLSRLPGLVGMTLLPSGLPSLIYNPLALMTLYGATARERTRQAWGGPLPAEVPQVVAADGVLAPLVMVVDDSLTVRRVTQRLLEREGYRVRLAKDGREALELLVGERPAVVLTDIEMPRMDGFELVRHMKVDARLATLPLIMITSRIAQKHRDYAAELGVAHYLGKPYAEEELLALVSRYARVGEPV